mmetsp:Transcript_3509/g.10359  ORF Transcript_3509/g.10359 Transcript_3509/m.10359 type:complete len:174 (-) Transcript_3509:68-589(-)
MQPKLVVFDLDACCWFPEMYMMGRGSPFAKTSNPDHMTSAGGETVKLLGITREVWSMLYGDARFAETGIAVASRCDEPAWARELLGMYEVAPGVSFWNALGDGRLAEIYKGSKIKHFEALRQKTGVAFSDMLFFDDDPMNISAVGGLGVLSILTPSGVTKDAWEQGLAKFAAS